MRNSTAKLLALATGTLLMLGGGSSALADDTEIYVGQTTTAADPNVMFIFDTSGSMSSDVTTTPTYNPATTYAGTGSCAGVGDRIYFAKPNNSGTTTEPNCSSSNWFPATSFRCTAGLAPLAAAGKWGDYLIRWGGNNNSKTWNKSLTVANGAEIDCQTDDGHDGDNTLANPAALPYPDITAGTGNINRARATGLWSATAANSYWALTNVANKQYYTLYTGNHVTFSTQFSTATVIGTRISIMQQAATDLLNSISGVNVGLMRYSNNSPDAHGGYVAYPVGPVELNRTNLINTINGYSPGGYTPLSETLYEAYLYFSGKPVLFGLNSQPAHSVASSRKPANQAEYLSPMNYSCQKSFIVYLTDGLPTQDTETDALYHALPNSATLGGACLTTSPSAGGGGGTAADGLCLGALAQYMYHADLRPLPTDPAGQQNVTTYFIGLGSDFGSSGGGQNGGGSLTSAFSYLDTAARRGGGQAYQANDLSQLSSAFTSIIAQVKQGAATFTAPTVAVNAFNQTRSLGDLYVSMFTPSATWHWPGNVKKYQLVNGTVVDATGAAAVDPTTGFFSDASQSIWSATTDGAKVELGGAANQLPVPANRNIYTYPYPGVSNVTAGTSNAVTLSGNANYAVAGTNTLLTDALLGTTGLLDPTRAKLIEWARGADVNDDNGDGSTTDPRYDMGDPMHSQPSVVIYGGTPSSPDITDATVYVATNDGYVHAFNAATGTERWAFIPPDLIGNLVNVYSDSATSAKQYSLDGDVTILKFDTNGDGIIDPSNTPAGHDRVLLYVGQGRGGSHYYALDVTDKANPKFLWNIGPTQLPNIGQAWAQPVISRMKIGTGSGQNSQQLVLVIAGGYDIAEDGNSTAGTYLSADSVGNRLYIVDAVYGTVLWSGGPTGAGTTQTFGTRMDHAIPAPPAVIDTNNDGYADRMYVGDMAGQLWRFDITNGNSAATLMAGGVLASLGAHDDASPVVANARRFYSTPDPAQVTLPNITPFMNVAIASGYRGHPLNATIQDRLYSYRDYQPFTAMTQAQYNAVTVTHDADMTDITGLAAPSVANGAIGWKMLLNQNGGWIGEKSLSAAQTVGGAIYYTTYTPGAGAAANPCSPATGVARAYVVNLLNGAAVIDLNNNGTVNQSDLSMVVPATGILPALTVLYRVTNSSGSPGSGGGSNGVAGGGTGSNTCLLGTMTIPCPPFTDKVKTYWREGLAN